MTFLLRYWKEIAIAILIAAIWFGGYHIKSLVDRAAQAAALEETIAEMNKKLAANDGNAAKYENERAALEAQLRNLQQQRSKPHAKNTDCQLDPVDVRVLSAGSHGLRGPTH